MPSDSGLVVGLVVGLLSGAVVALALYVVHLKQSAGGVGSRWPLKPLVRKAGQAERPAAVPPGQPSPPPSDANEPRPLPAQKPKVPPTRLELGRFGSPAVAIERLPAVQVQNLKPVPNALGLAEQLSPMLAHAPALLANAGVLASDLYVLTFAPSVAHGLRAGTLDLAQAVDGGYRALAIDTHGTIVAQGTLNIPQGIQWAAAGALVWQAVSILVGQAHLSRINTQLGVLSDQVATVVGTLRNDRTARIEAAAQFLKNEYAALQASAIDRRKATSLRHQLDDIEREAMSGVLAALADCRQNIQALPSTPMPNLVGTDKDAGAIATHLLLADQSLQQAISGIYLRGLAAQFLATQPDDQQHARMRLTQIQADRSFQPILEELESAYKAFANEKITSKVYKDEAAKNRSALHAQVEAVVDAASQSLRRIAAANEEALRLIEDQIARDDEPLKLVVRYKDKQVLEVSRL